LSIDDEGKRRLEGEGPMPWPPGWSHDPKKHLNPVLRYWFRDRSRKRFWTSAPHLSGSCRRPGLRAPKSERQVRWFSRIFGEYFKVHLTSNSLDTFPRGLPARLCRACGRQSLQLCPQDGKAAPAFRSQNRASFSPIIDRPFQLYPPLFDQLLRQLAQAGLIDSKLRFQFRLEYIFGFGQL
jgi:hypothetical protein